MDKKRLDEWEKMKSKFDFNEKFVRQNIKRSKYKIVWLNAVKIACCSFMFIFVLTNTSTMYVKAVREIPLLNLVTKWLTISPDVVANKEGYVQQLHMRYVDENVSLYIQKLVADEQSLYLYFNLYDMRKDHTEKLKYHIQLLDEGKRITDLYYTNATGPDVIYCDHQLNGKEKFTLRFECGGKETLMDIPLNHEEMSGKETFILNQEVKVDGQSIVIDKMVVYPLSTRLYVKESENNIYDVFNLDFETIVGGVGISSENEENKWENPYIIAVEPSPYFMDEQYEVYLKTVDFVKEVHVAKFDAATMEIQSDEEMFEVIGIFKPGDMEFDESIKSEDHKKFDYMLQLRPKDKFVSVNNYSNYEISGDCYWKVSFQEDVINIYITEDNIKNHDFEKIEVKVVETFEVNEKLKLK